jgi:hypothetical protein
MRGKRYNEETRLKVFARYLAGESIPAISTAEKVPERTIREWFQTDAFADIRESRSEKLEDLLYNLLTSSLEALTHISKAVSSHEYIMSQNAKHLARLYMALTYTCFRLLAAYSPRFKDL